MNIGKALRTLLVDNPENHIAELGEQGLETSAIDTVPGLYRKAVITDPEGNMTPSTRTLAQATEFCGCEQSHRRLWRPIHLENL